MGVFNVVPAENSTYDDDCRAEDGSPDIRVSLYSLDVKEIEDCFNNIEQCPYGYVLAGDKAITRLVNDEKGQSCCGLAYELLVAGKVLTLSSIFKDIKAKWVVVTPDNFSDFIKNAKAAEWKKYPETQGFDRLPNEYTLQAAPPPTKMCLIL